MAFIADNPYLAWFFLAVVFFVLEDLSVTFFLIFFGFGALVTAAATFFLPLGYEMQMVVFIAVSLASLLMLRRKIRSFFHGYLAKGDNLDDPVISSRYIGRDVSVVKDIPSGDLGLVELDGTNWRARCDGAGFPSGERVRVKAVEGLVLVVGLRDGNDGEAK